MIYHQKSVECYIKFNVMWARTCYQKHLKTDYGPQQVSKLKCEQDQKYVLKIVMICEFKVSSPSNPGAYNMYI